MWLGGIALLIAVLCVGILLLTLWLALALRPRPIAAGGAMVILIAVTALSTPNAWGRHALWSGLYGRPGPSEVSTWWSPRPPWIVAPLPGTQTLRLRTVDFAFRPSVLAAPPGVPLNLELINSGMVVHTVAIPVLGVRATLLPGERRTVRIGRVEPGTYEFFCAIPAHRDAGMIGRLVVGPAN